MVATCCAATEEAQPLTAPCLCSQSSIDFAKPLKDADMTPLGYTNNVGINGSNELTCDGESINNPPTSSTRASLTTYALIAAIGGFVLSVGIALFIAVSLTVHSVDSQ